MKNLINYLSKKSLSLGNGPALDRRWTGHESGRFLSILTLFLTLFSFGVGNAWGASVTWEQVAWGDIATSDVIIVTVTSGGTTYLLESSHGTSATPKLDNTGTLTNSNTNCTFNEIDAVKWKKDASNRLCMATDATKWLYTAGSNNGMRVGTSTNGNTWTLDGDYIKASSTNRYLSVYGTTDFRSYTSKPSGQVTRFYKAASCSTKPTVGSSLSSVSATVNSITATVPISAIGGCNITENGLVYSTSVATPTVGAANCTKVITTACGSTAANKTVTISDLPCGTSYYVRGYATNAAGTSYTNVTTQSTSACPLYTVTLMDDSDTRTQASYGAAVTLPSRAGCSGYTFAGWSTTYNANWTTTVPTIISAGSYTPTDNINLYPVYTKTEGGSEEDHDGPSWIRSGGSNTCTSGYTFATASSMGSSADYYQDGSATTGQVKLYHTSTAIFSSTPTSVKLTAKIGGGTGGTSLNTPVYAQLLNSSGTAIGNATEITSYITTNTGDTYTDVELDLTGITSAYGVMVYHAKQKSYNVRYYSFSLTYTTGGSTTSYISVPNCCTDPELNYGTGSVTKTFGNGTFKNTLTNSHSVSVTYESSNTDVATVASDGTVTIQGAGNATITARFAGNSTYCADEASYTLTVNKANISPTLTYPNSVAAGSSTSAPTVGGNPGSGGVTYAITSATPAGCATIDAGTGVVTGVAVGSVTVTATVAATDNYNGGSATATVTITAASGYCISAFNSSNNGITSGFSNGGSGNEYTLNYTIPGKDGSSNWPQYWIGENEAWASFSANALFADMHFTHSDATLGLAEGATGKLHIWDDNKASGSNLWVKFEPDGYGFRWGGAGEWDQAANTKAFTVDPGNANTYWTEIVTLDGTNNTTWNYYVGLQSASGYVYSGVDNEASDSRGISRTRSVTTMKVSNGTAGSYKATYLNSEATGTRGKFRIWDNNISDHNFVCHFVPYYRVTYNGSGASGSTDPSADVSCEGNDAARTVVAAANGFTVPTGKSFGGWASSPENAAAGVVAYAAGADVVLTSSITLYAIWTDINYTVTVNQNPSVGATTTGQTTTAHYNGTINLTTTVPSGYRFVNWTTSDGFSITNPTSATTASFTMPNKNVTVTANFQQTHTVDWYVGGSAPANKIGDDGQTTVVDHGGKISDFPAHDPDGSACDKEFVGWTNTSSYVHGTSPLFNDVAGSPTINANASFYAVFATGGGDDFELVTAVSQLHVGDVVTIANFVGNSESGAVIKAYNSGNNWPKASASTDASGKISGSTTDMQTFTLEEGSVDDTWAFNDGTGYPYAASSSSNHMKREAAKSANSSFSITIDGSTSVATIVAQGDYTRNVMQYNSSSNLFACYGSASQASVYLYKKPSYTGHTITCADCGTSVTPTYTASPTGGTVSVTKNAAAVASGSTVKTCTSQDLTVTLTPATHYDLTGFTATGLTTGTATITPAVGSTLPVSVAQTFTVTVSAGATGTLTLAPTFTPETPLTITLNTNGKGTFTTPTEFPIYAGETFTFPDVTPNDPSCATFVGWIEGTTFVGDGTTHDAPVTIAASSSSGAQSSNTTYTAVFYETETSESDAYVKVTAAPEPPATWANDHYLIVYEDAGNSYTNAVAFAGSRDNGDNGNIDATSNGIAVTIVGGNTIAATSSLAANEWRIAAVTGGYSIQSASGYYIGRAANSNGIDASNSTAYVNTIGYSDSRTNITSAGGKILKYNTAGDQLRFRYLTSAGDIQLYKLGTAVVETRTYTTNPSCTPKYRVTVASVTGGSPSADPKFNPESTTVTITANPSAGYSFTSWTITKTTGGDNVTSTLLTGDKPTTANTTFTMPAYDITIAATYAKKMVSTLEVKDGATVISTTTGPVSGTVNISTGANKTLDVVITPSDAYDHSWTASVTAGGTYASITNVTDDGFRVNGLAQGDATITVNAPNDGSAKSVTLTVHVTDIMPEEIILKREGSDTPIETLIMYYDASESKGQYVKVNVSYSPSNPTNKAFTFSSALSGKVGSHSHAPASGYEVLVANGVTTDPVNCTFTSSADGSVTKVLAVTVLPILSDRFVDYVHGNATQTVSARLSDDRYSIIPDINTPSLSDASDANPTSEDCETSHYHLVGWLPQTTAEALWAAGTPITDATEGLVRAGESVEATGQTWCAIWAEEQ